MANRIIAFDFLRVIAFILVVLQHCSWWFLDKYGQNAIISNLLLGDVGVSFFIVLSGCALAFSNSKRSSSEEGAIFYKKFLIKRGLSIYPSFWIAYLVVSLLLFVFFGEFFSSFGYKELLLTIFGLDGWYILRYPSLYRIGEWFTGFILIVYLLCPPILIFMKKKPYLTVFVALLISFSTIVFFSPVQEALPKFLIHPVAWCNPTSRLFEFSLGALITSAFILKYPGRPQKSERTKDGIIIVCCFTWVALFFMKYYWIGYSQAVYMLRSILLSCTSFIIIFLILQKLEWLIARIPSVASIVAELSKLSFLAFLFHHVIVLKVISMLNDGGAVNPYTYFIFLFTVVVLFSFILAFCTHPIVERLTFFLRNVLLKPS